MTKIRRFVVGDEVPTCEVVKKSFDEFVAPSFTRQGIEEFLKFAKPDALAQRITKNETFALVAEEEGGSGIVGMIEFRPRDLHICLLFVLSSHQKRGIARSLLARALETCDKEFAATITETSSLVVTVNSSPFAEPIYVKLGFSRSGPPQTLNGISFIPMAMTRGRKPKTTGGL